MILCVFAVLAVGAVTSASASAAHDPCPTEESTGTEFDLCAEKSPTETEFVELGSPETSNFGTDGVQAVETRLKGKLVGVAAEFKCKKIDIKLEVEDSNKGKGKVNFSECEQTKPAGCKLSAKQEKEILVDVTSQIDEEGAGKIGTEFWGKTGGPTKEEEEFTPSKSKKSPARNASRRETSRSRGRSGAKRSKQPKPKSTEKPPCWPRTAS
jgi:hypothetical protein